MLQYLFGIGFIMIEVLCCKLFLETFTDKRKQVTKKKEWFVFILSVFLAYGMAIFVKEIVWKQVLFIGMMSLAMYFLFEVAYRKSLLLVTLYQGLLLLVDYLVLVIVVKIVPNLTMEILLEENFNIFVSLLCKILLFCCVIMLKAVFGNKDFDMMTNREWFRFSVFPIFTILSIGAMIANFEIYNTSKQMNILLWIAFGMLLMNVIIFYLIYDILQREKKLREIELFQERAENETRMYQSISENFDKQRKRVHEYKNQISCIVALANRGEYVKLEEYLQKIDNEMRSSIDMIDTNHVIVNAILNTKYREAREKGIVFVIKVNDLSAITMQDEDIVIILSNLLNNAIEACTMSDDKIIKLKFVRENNNIIISIMNTMRQIPIVEDGKFKTTKKEESAEHGVGIQNIVQVIEKYHGNYVIDYDENEFRFKILIPE